MGSEPIDNEVPGNSDRFATRRIELLNAADAVIRRRGPAASMEEIAGEAGISKPILYRHFGNKGGLYQALAQLYAQHLMEELRGSLIRHQTPRTRLEATVDTYLAFIDREKDLYQFLMHRAMGEGPEARATLADFVRHLSEEIAQVMRRELASFGIDTRAAEVWARGIVGMVHATGDWWLEHQSMPRDQLVDYVSTLLWNGFIGLQAAYGGEGRPSTSRTRGD